MDEKLINQDDLYKVIAVLLFELAKLGFCPSEFGRCFHREQGKEPPGCVECILTWARKKK